ncbi:MAG: ABC transporter permease [Pseudomonadota bacterium]
MRTLPFHFAAVLIRIFLRDRQSLFFSLFFPLFFLLALGFMTGRTPDAVGLGVVDLASSPLSAELIDRLQANPGFDVQVLGEVAARDAVIDGNLSLALVVPASFDATPSGTEIRVLVDAAQMRRLAFVLPVLEQALVDIERQFRGLTPMFRLTLEDIKARSQRYADFLLPGILAFSLMQISIAGSGFNIVEYRRKGILKRVSVTPIRPRDFIAAISLARLVLCLLQVSVLILVAVLVLQVHITGNLLAIYTVIIMGTLVFLCIGFCVGSLAHTQQAVGAIGNLVIFPQVFLSGVFIPTDNMPDVIHPIIEVLPLTFVVDSLRAISNDGASLLMVWHELLGIFAWMVLSFFAASRLFVWKDVVRS